MKISGFIRQTWRLLRESPVLGFVSILGTALAIGLVTITVASQRLIPEGNMYPAYKRSRMLYYKKSQEKSTENEQTSSSSVGLKLAQRIAGLTTPECVSISEGYADSYPFRRAGEQRELTRFVLGTDANFWQVYDFDFVSGHPFTAEDVEAANRVIIIDEPTAHTFFGNESALGQELLIGFKPTRVIGVVKPVSSFISAVAANAWMPYSVAKSFMYAGELRGPYKVEILAYKASDFPKIRKELDEVLSRYDAELAPRYISRMDQPDELRASLARVWSNVGPDMKQINREFYVSLILLFLLPGINLIVISHARMRRRLQELGVRKAFGATTSDLLWQVFQESLVYTIVGAILGIVLLVIAAYGMQSMFFESFASDMDGVVFSIPLSSILSWRVLLVAILSSFFLNASAMLIPAWQMARRDIVYSLSIKR